MPGGLSLRIQVLRGLHPVRVEFFWRPAAFSTGTLSRPPGIKAGASLPLSRGLEVKGDLHWLRHPRRLCDLPFSDVRALLRPLSGPGSRRWGPHHHLRIRLRAQARLVETSSKGLPRGVSSGAEA